MGIPSKSKTTPRKMIANAWRALERAMDDAGINWSDIGNWVEVSEKLDESKYTEDELQQFGQARHAEGIEAGIKIGEARKGNGGGNGHFTPPKPAEMAEYCHQRTNQMKNDWQRDFITDIFVVTRHTKKLSLPRLANLAKIYIEIGGRI